MGHAVIDEEANIAAHRLRPGPNSPTHRVRCSTLILERLFKLMTLSNCDYLSYRGSNLRPRIEYDTIYTARDIGSYKSSPRNFKDILGRLKEDFSLEKSDLPHTSQSVFHDHNAPANQFGLASAWIDGRQANKGWARPCLPRQAKVRLPLPRHDRKGHGAPGKAVGALS